MNIKGIIRNLYGNPRLFIENILRYPPIANLFSDKTAIKMFYYLRFHNKIDLKDPVSFNEKLLWLTLYDRRPEYVQMVDKYEAKSWLKAKLGGDNLDYLIPTYGIYNSFKEIDFDVLPESFVMKTTHDSGGVVIVNKKSELNRKKAEEKLEKSLSRNYFYFSREWAYKDVKPRIIIEKKLESYDIVPDDYKIYCLNGKARFALVVQGRYRDVTEDFYDINWNPLPFTRGGHRVSINRKPCPKCWTEMIRIAEAVSKGYPMIRVDFFVDKYDKLYIGELTLTPASGLQAFSPKEWDIKIGEMLELPKRT